MYTDGLGADNLFHSFFIVFVLTAYSLARFKSLLVHATLTVLWIWSFQNPCSYVIFHILRFLFEVCAELNYVSIVFRKLWCLFLFLMSRSIGTYTLVLIEFYDVWPRTNSGWCHCARWGSTLLSRFLVTFCLKRIKSCCLGFGIRKDIIVTMASAHQDEPSQSLLIVDINNKPNFLYISFTSTPILYLVRFRYWYIGTIPYTL